MSDSTNFVSRRGLIAAGLAALPATAFAARGPVVTLLGDSISSGYGLPAAAALPAQLQAELKARGVAAMVRNAGVAGDTTAGGLARVNFSVQPDTAVCVVALGGNDLLQGLPPRTVQANLDRLLTRLKQRNKAVVLCGIEAPVEIGGGYAREFNAVFPALARTHRVPLYPNILAGVARVPALIQPDGLHPNARGVQVIARRLAPMVAKALSQQA
ncbi:arylesterase [Phenylobacterium sp. J367]|uniref:arylesterase n=1 Tax=Phenylobacterium sp. J367 TaxID=2898435 RepID=UPI002151A993|nr:arylesterase [Phenylobacterium sp. J367]MCR5880872.1 arylesterase [Phenylobacterium sp. J367]